MSYFLITLGAAMIIIGLLFPFLTKLGLGTLPGDFHYQKGSFNFYFPLATSLIVSALVSLLIWLINKFY
jgi:hypothetical protein